MATPAKQQFEIIGEGFVAQYYQFFGSNRAAVAGVYRDSSLMTWSKAQLQGTQAIMEKFRSLTLGQARFQPQEIDCHPTATGGVLVVVNGEVVVEGERHTLSFNDVFVLATDASGQWYVQNQIFRILGGGSN